MNTGNCKPINPSKFLEEKAKAVDVAEGIRHDLTPEQTQTARKLDALLNQLQQLITSMESFAAMLPKAKQPGYQKTASLMEKVLHSEVILNRIDPGDLDAACLVKPFSGSSIAGIAACGHPRDSRITEERSAVKIGLNMATDDLYQQILERDNFTCQHCGYYSPRHLYLEIHHKNGRPDDRSESNLEATCHFCHAPHHLGDALQRGAMLVALDMPQSAISRLARLMTRSKNHIPFKGGIAELFEAAAQQACEILGGDAAYSSLRSELSKLKESPEALRALQSELYTKGLRLAFPLDSYCLSNQETFAFWSNYCLSTTLDRNLITRYASFQPLPCEWCRKDIDRH